MPWEEWSRLRLRLSLSGRLRTFALALTLAFASASCTLPGRAPIPVVGGETPTPAVQAEQCRGDGAVQTWMLLAQQPAESELLTAYRNGQVVEFEARVVGQNDAPARLPHRGFTIAETAEGVTMMLDYEGDPPPLVQGQTYRMIAWTDFLPEPAVPMTATQTPQARPPIPEGRGYELQVYDPQGLLFLGLTDVDLQDDPLDIELTNGEGACVQVTILNNPCVTSRLVQPLQVRWGEDELTLYPGNDGQIQHQGATYEVSVFRNRQVQFSDPACPDYYEHRRSLRIERLDPPPVAPTLPPITSTVTATITATQSITAPVPQPAQQ